MKEQELKSQTNYIRIMDNDVEEKELTLLVNSYYFLVEASDIILRKTEQGLQQNCKGLRQEYKLRHNRIMREFHVLKNMIDDFWIDYNQNLTGTPMEKL